MGIDFSPAAVAFAKAQVEEAGLDCTLIQRDIRTADVWQRLWVGHADIWRIQRISAGGSSRHPGKAYHALTPGGVLLLEPHTYAQIVALGEEPASWYSAASGLFSATPHLGLQENGWDERTAWR